MGDTLFIFFKCSILLSSSVSCCILWRLVCAFSWIRTPRTNALWAVYNVEGLLAVGILMSKYSVRRFCMNVVLAGIDMRYGSFLQLVANEWDDLSPIHMEMGAWTDHVMVWIFVSMALSLSFSYTKPRIFIVHHQNLLATGVMTTNYVIGSKGGHWAPLQHAYLPLPCPSLIKSY